MLAAQSGQTDTVKVLIETGAKVNLKNEVRFLSLTVYTLIREVLLTSLIIFNTG